MTETATIPRPVAPPRRTWYLDRTLAGWTVLGWVVALAAAHLTYYGLARPRAVMVLESLTYLVLYLGLLSFAPVRAWITGIPSPHRAVFAGFVFLLTWGQLVVDSRTTFPFTAWTMYARPEPRQLVEYYRYRGIDARSLEVAVDPAQEFTFVNSAEIASRVKYIGRAVTDPRAKPGRREEARARLHDLLAALATAYGRSHPGAPLRSLEFMRYSWDYRHQTAAEVVPSMVMHIDIPEDRAP